MAQFPNTTAADGIWTLKKVRRAILGDNWPPLFFTDEYWANTVLLLQADDQTDGGQNNTFLDTSGNGHAITRNGNVTQGSFSPFAKDDGKWGVHFDGTGDYIRFPSDSSFAFGTGDFTVEGWIWWDGTGTGPTLYDAGASNSAGSLWIGLYTGTLYFRIGGLGNDLSTSLASSGITANTWFHIAATRESGTVRVYVDGTQILTGTRTQNITQQQPYVGFNVDGGNITYKGYLSNFRAVKGTAVYTGASGFTPPTAPLTAISGTSGLIAQSNRFIDKSSNAHSITVNGDTKVTTFSPFAQTTAYSPSVNGGSGYFDGSGDYLVSADSTEFDFGTGDFTIEGWINPAITDGNFKTIFSIGGPVQIYSKDSNVIAYFNNSDNTSNYIVSALGGPASSVKANTWTHFAVVRNGTTFTTYINGVAGTPQTSSATVASSVYAPAIGTYLPLPTSYLFYGNISDFRIVKGTALYQGNFTPPTAPLNPVSGTSLLCNFTNASIIDRTGSNVLETVGNAQIDTATYKYGDGALYFDGTGDYLEAPSSPNLDMGTGDWTIEGWFYLDTRTNNYPLLVGNNNGSYSAGALALTVSNADSASYNDKLVFANYDDAADRLLIADSTHNTGQWYHFALVRNGANITIYRDGTSVATESISASLTYDWGKNGLLIGGGNWDGANSYIDGYIDDLRITKGVARYTANFTPPEAVLPIVGE